ncbi:PP2C family protein-serine/threonine phosphatase [Listeria booriae]|uniref:PP2C family protein-serine/threonine phosphatase n=1 Tax=Listeria booriae TaxID=1552123 RepID=UPI00164DD769|nr:hypothetical protein [Listeria booriae]MBC6301283.1 hypothetical protein [Listeria booriae]
MGEFEGGTFVMSNDFSFLLEPLVWIGIVICLLIVIRMVLMRQKKKCSYTAFQIMPDKLEPERFSYVYQKDEEQLFIVTDGVGDDARTKVIASDIATKKISHLFEQKLDSEDGKAFLKRACFQAHRAISENINHGSGGCSIGIVYVTNRQMTWVSSGNVGIYSCEREIKQLNQLDIYKHQLKEHFLSRKINPEKIQLNLIKNELTSYLGCDNFKHVEIGKMDVVLGKKAKILIVTNVIQELVTPLEMEEILNKNNHLEDKKMQLQEKFLQRGTLETDGQKASAIIIEGF